MALNIAAMQQPMNLVDQFIEGRALRQAEEMRGAQMTALQNAEGRAAEEGQRQAQRFDWERKDTENKFEQINGQKTLAKVQQVMAMPKNQRKGYIEQNEPEFVKELESKTGQSWADLDDDEIDGMGNMLVRKISGDLGLSPKAPTPLSDQGKVAADVKSGLLTPGQGDAILNASEYTAPEAGIIDGKEVVYQANKKTGEPRVIPGVSPRPQKPLVSIEQRAELASEKKFGELEAEAFSGVLQRGQDAQDKAQSLRTLLANPAKTGPTQDYRAAANAFFKDIGVPIAQSKIDQIKGLAGYTSVVNQLVLTELVKQKGTQTDRDTQRVQDTLPQTKNIAEANELILKYQLALAERESLLSERAEAFRESKGKIDGWRKELRAYVRDTPLVGNDPDSGRLVFWNEFLEGMKEDNPEATDDQIMSYWRDRYGRARK